MEERDKDLVPRFWFCLLFTFPFFVKSIDHFIQWLLATIILVVGSYSFFQKACSRRISIYTLFSAAVGMLYFYSLLEGLLSSKPTLYYGMVASLTTLILLEQIVESSFENKVDLAFAKLAAKAPQKAQKLFPDGHSEEVSVDSLKTGDIVRIAPGDTIPIDGVVIGDELEVDESLLSGDSTVVKKAIGSALFAGTQAVKGSCLAQSTRVGSKSLFSQILTLVKIYLGSQSPMQAGINKLTSGIMAALIAFSCFVFFFWALFTGLDSAILVISTLLVAVCPCALILGASVVKQLTALEGISQGIIIRDGSSIDEVANCNILVTNKNSTLTTGQPTIVSLDPAAGITQDELLITAASLEPKSVHPYAVCITEKALRANHTLIDLQEIKEVPGLGVKGTLDGVTYLIGDEKLMEGIPLDYFKVRAEDMRKQGYIVLFCAKGQKLLGLLVISDPVRSDVKETLRAFKNEGFHLFCLSGDRRVTIVQLVNALGFDRFQAEAPAHEKTKTVLRLQKEGKHVLMIGDPVNDVDALCKANSGIALGTKGNLLQEKAPIVILTPTLSAALRVFKLGKSASSIMKQNVIISCLYMIVALFMAAFGSLGPAHGAFYMMLSVVVVGLNSLRILR